MTVLAQTPPTVALSQNETESLCMKAARGAGYSWGLAEEAGFAAGWLAARGYDATQPLLELLTKRASAGVEFGKPFIAMGHWQAKDGQPLCPITLGASLADSALLAGSPFDHDTSLDPVDAPILLIPFLARAAQLRGKAIVLDAPFGPLLICANGAVDGLSQIGCATQSPQPLTLRPAQQDAVAAPHPAPRIAQISIPVLQALNALALRTTVPATEASRRGAGSATSDND